MSCAADRKTLLGRARARFLVPFLFLVVCGAALGQQEEDWASSPEAYFLTREEREEWKTLDSRDSRQAFKERYWLKRDPTPGTEKNEFREMVLARIKTADKRFGIEKTPGSRTARGQVFILFGSPARVQDVQAPRPEAPRPPVAGQIGSPVGWVEGTEVTSTWIYDRERTPLLLQALNRPSLEITIVMEPNRRNDSIQNAGLFNEFREVLARKSIVNPDLVSPSVTSVGHAGTGAPEALPRQPLAASARGILEAAEPAARRGGAFVGSAVVWKEKGDAETLLWVFTPPTARRPVFHALVRAEDGREVATVSEPAAASSLFSMRAAGLVALRRLRLPPGSYSASVALTEEGGGLLARAVSPLDVPSLEKTFAVSSLLLTRGPAAPEPGSDRTFSFGDVSIPPTADAVFSQSESLWYFVEVANPANPKEVTFEARLRRGAQPLGGTSQFVAKLHQIGLGRYLSGIEMSLEGLEPGDYSLYLRVTDGRGADRASVLRRADFRLER